MVSIWLCAVIALIAAGAGVFIGYKIFYKKGWRDGTRNREKEILTDYVIYVPLGEIGDFAKELIEEDGYSPTFPWLVVMPDKYNYLEGAPLPGEIES